MKMTAERTMRIFAAMVACTALCSCAHLRGTSEAPAPGTRAFYEQNIEGRYAYQNGALVPLTVTGVPRPTRTPITIPRPLVDLVLDGEVSQILNPTTIVIRTKTPLLSGAARITPYVVKVRGDRSISTNQHLNLRIWSNYTRLLCDTSDGQTNKIVEMREEVAPATFEEYLDVYRAESKTPDFGSIVSYRPVPPMPIPTYPGVIRRVSVPAAQPTPRPMMPAPSAPGVPPGPAPVTPPPPSSTRLIDEQASPQRQV